MKDLILKSARKHSSDYLSEKKMPDIDNYQMMPSPDSRNFSDGIQMISGSPDRIEREMRMMIVNLNTSKKKFDADLVIDQQNSSSLVMAPKEEVLILRGPYSAKHASFAPQGNMKW